MHIAIDVREACRGERTGKGTWTYGFVSELLKRDVHLTLFTNRPLPREWEERVGEEYSSPTLFEERVTGYRLQVTDSGILWHLKVAHTLKRLNDIDYYISPTSTIVPALVGKHLPCIPIIHDLIAFRREPHEWRARWIEQLTLGRAIRYAPLICTVSEDTREHILQRYPVIPPRTVVSISAGPSNDSPPPNIPDGRTILCIGTLCPRKNQLRLIEAFRNLGGEEYSSPPRFHLFLMGKRGWHDATIVQQARSTPCVEWIGYGSKAQEEELLSRCTVFALPSLYEGFGLPLLDALQRGIPVLTSDRGALKEVAGDAAIFVNPESTSSILEGLRRLLEDPNLRERLSNAGREQAKKFSWKRTVDTFLFSLDRIIMPNL